VVDWPTLPPKEIAPVTRDLITERAQQGVVRQQLVSALGPELTRVKQRWGDDGSPRRAAD
jgi:hypothetical protein